MVVVAIIGILAAIAIPQFNEYRTRSFDSRALADLRNGAVGEESYYAINSSYISCANTAACQVAIPQFSASAGTILAFTDAGTSFAGSASHPSGTGTVYIWDSARGGLQ